MPTHELSRRATAVPISMAQVPLVGSTAFIVVFLWIAAPRVLSHPQLLAALVCIAVGTTLAVVVPWRLFAPEWMIVVTSIDVAGIGFLAQGLDGTIPGIDGLIIFPAIWIAYSFAGPVLVLLLLGEIALTLSPFMFSGHWPTTALGWGATLLIQIIIAFVAISVRTAAQQLQRQASELSAISVEWKNSLIVADDRQALIDTVLDNVDSAIVFFDRAGKVYLINDPARRALAQSGGTEAPELGAPFVYESNGTTLLPVQQQVIPRALRGDFVTDQLNWVGQPETRNAFSMTSRVVSRSSGEAVGTLVIAHDVTTLVEAIGARDDFLGSVSRELRGPLYSIAGELDEIVGMIDPTRLGIAGRIDTVESESKRLIALVTDLFGSADDKVPVFRRTSDISLIARDAAESITAAVKTGHLTLVVTVPSTLPAVVDAPRVGSAIESLLSNAVKFTPPGGTITLSAEASGNDVLVHVTDDGIGISEQDQANIFDRFYRARSSRLGQVPGSGLGLSRVKAIVAAHGGEIVVRSEPTMGSDFTMRLPALPPSVAPRP